MGRRWLRLAADGPFARERAGNAWRRQFAVMIESYRSYVIRVRQHAVDAPIRLDLEDLLGGRHVAIVGDAARSLAEQLRSMLATSASADAHAKDGSATAGPDASGEELGP
jgi:hypothetical protein